MFLTLLGRPGAGKTTLGHRLAARFEIPYVGGGQMMREYVRDAREGHEEVAKNLKLRRDNPPELQLRMLRDRLKRDAGSGAVLDGFPKTLELAECIDRELPVAIEAAMFLDVPIELAEYRVAHRLICGDCGMPGSDTTCAPGASCEMIACGGAMLRRPDDHSRRETRQREHKESLRLRSHYESRGRLLVLSGAVEAAKVETAAVALLRGRGIEKGPLVTEA